MLKIRFQRTGRKNDPSFRIVVGEHTKHPTAGGHTAIVGSYHPKTKATVINAEAVRGWIKKGAQPSGTVHNLLISKNIIEGKKINVLKKRVVAKKEEDEASTASPSNDTPPTEEAPIETEEVKKEGEEGGAQKGE